MALVDTLRKAIAEDDVSSSPWTGAGGCAAALLTQAWNGPAPIDERTGVPTSYGLGSAPIDA